MLSILSGFSKEEYIQKILSHENSNKFKYKMGKIHGEMYNYINNLREIKDLDTLKEFFNEIILLKFKES